jgi:hypothetical protein
MGHAILYCSGCSKQLREPDFDRGAAFRFDGRVFCVDCAPAEARAQAAPPPPKSDLLSISSTGKIPKIASPPSTTRLKSPEPEQGANKVILIAGIALVVVALLAAVMFSGKDSPPPRRPDEPPSPVAQPKIDPTPVLPVGRQPLPPPANDKEAEEAVRRAREYAKANPDDLAGQLAQYDAAARAAALTGHAAAVAREREAVQVRLKALMKTRLEALDASVKAAADREEFGPALKLIDDARAQGLGTEWLVEVDQRSGTVQGNARQLFDAVRSEAVEAQKRGSDEDVRRLTERVEKWGMELLKSDLAKALAAAVAKKPTPPARPIEVYRKKWTEAMGDAGFRDFPGALKKLEEAKAGQSDPAVLSESAADLDLFRQAISSEEEALQLLAKMPKGQKLSLFFLTVAGRVEMTGTVARNENHEIELAGEKGSVRIPLGEISARSLGQVVREKRQDRGAAVLCLMDGDVQGAKTLVDGPAVLPDKYWSFKPPTNGPAQSAARRLFYGAERDMRVHSRTADAIQSYATLLKDHATVEFVRRNRGLIAARAEAAPREFYFLFEDLRVGGAIRSFKGEKDEPYWKTLADAKANENFVELGFLGLADTEYRAWIYVGGCCTEIVSCSFQVFDGEEPPGEPVPVKLPSMQYKTHESHAGRGRPVTKWGWAQVPLPKFTKTGAKRVRISAPLKGFSAAEALVTATRPGFPATPELRELERLRIEARGRTDYSLVGHWRLDGSPADSGPYGIDGKLNKGTWLPGTATPWAPPSLRIDGGYFNLGTNLTLAQSIPACTISAWIWADKVGAAENEQYVIFSVSRYNNGAATPEGRVYLSMLGGGVLTAGVRPQDKSATLHFVKSEKILKSGAWLHVAGVIDLTSDSMSLYLNGTPQTTLGTVKFGLKSTPNTPSANGAIGADDDGKSQFFPGRLADVRIYNRALSKEEVAELAVPR